MGGKRARLTLQELQAFLDSDLKAERGRMLGELVEKRPDLKAQLEEWRKVRSDFHTAYDGILDEPVPQELLEVLAGREEE